MRTVERPLDDEPSHEAKPREVVHFWRWLGLITASGLGLRLLVVVLSRHEKVTGDGYEWSAQGNLNAAGHWFVSPITLRPDALRPPGWAIVLTVWAWLGQHSWFSQQILACVIGSATVLLVGVCARQLTGDRAGLVAAGIAAGYAALWLYERALLSEVLLLPEIAVFHPPGLSVPRPSLDTRGGRSRRHVRSHGDDTVRANSHLSVGRASGRSGGQLG